MSLTLSDLIVKDYTRHKVYPDRRPASLADLIEVLIQEGAVEIYTASGEIPPDEPGWYLVLPLDTP